MTATTQTRLIDRMLAEYGESHQDETNKAVHWVCVPLIAWTVIAALWSLPVPAAFSAVPGLNWAVIGVAATLVYYIRMSPSLAAGFVVFAGVCVAAILLHQAVAPWPLWAFAAVVFVLAWVAQFWGHKIEGKKPSFLKDLQFLLIGPAWLMSFIYRRLGLRY
ncbi:MAG: Mpo1-like protein [Pseudomonadota bacterium]